MGADERVATLKRFSESGELDVRGVTISDAFFREIFDVAPHDADGRRTFTAAWFDGATFEGDAWFDGATFEDDAEFDGVTFKVARFDGATFKGYAEFGFGAAFAGGADLRFGTTFKDAWFAGATFEDDAEFDGAKWSRP